MGFFSFVRKVKGNKFIVAIVVFVDEDNFYFFLITNALIIYLEFMIFDFKRNK